MVKMLPFYHPLRISKSGKSCATHSLYCTSSIEGLGLYVAYIVCHVVRIKKHSYFAVIEIERQ